MIVQLWNRDVEVSEDQQQRLIDYVLDRLSRTTDERESVTHMVTCIRSYTGIKFPTRMVDAEKMFEALGFTLMRQRNTQGCILRTFVTV